MPKKLMSWKTKGMNRDMSASAFNPEFAFENINLRLSTNEGNTMMSWVNERGTRGIELDIKPICFTEEQIKGFSEENKKVLYKYIQGTPLGTAVLNHQLVIFTHTEDNKAPDIIYAFKKTDRVNKNGEMILEGRMLYRGILYFDIEHPLETLVSFESEDIQKVYWTDNYNQPRMINIAPSMDEQTKSYNKYSFDFVPTLQLKETVKVRKIFGSGEFPAGVIQYAFTYYNKYGQESNIFHTTPLQYIAYLDRGGKPGSKIANSFRIGINKIDHHFDYVRIYSILRTSKNATPLVKRIADLPISASTEDGTSEAKGTTFGRSNMDDYEKGKTLKLSMLTKIDQITKLDNNYYVQGAAAYNKYLFQAYIAGKYIDVIDLTTNRRIATLETDIDYNFDLYHGNVLSFGEEVIDGSNFPYLYYSCEYNREPCILIFKIVQENGTWKGKKVNKIYLPKSNGGASQLNEKEGKDGFTHYYQNGCVDVANHCIWVSGYTQENYKQNTGSYEGNQLIYRKYELPMTFGEDIYLSAENVLDSFTLPFKKGTQGMVIRDNKLYQCFGYDKEDTFDEYLDCIDLEAKEIAWSYQFPKTQLQDLGEELESPYIYNDNLYLSATCGGERFYTLWNLAFSSGGSGGVVIGPAIESKYELSYIDDGLHGDTIDPTELLYKGGEEIVASTMEQKDGTLFFGNVKVTRPQLSNLSNPGGDPIDLKQYLLKANGIVEKVDGNLNEEFPLLNEEHITIISNKRSFTVISPDPLCYVNTLFYNTEDTYDTYDGASTFKGGEYYRLGVQFQYKNGKWSEPCWIGDVHNTKYPKQNKIYTNLKNYDELYLPEFEYTLKGVEILETLYNNGYRKARPVFVLPKMSDRTILCQGVGCPTVYRNMDRYVEVKEGDNIKLNEGKLYAQASWLFRAVTKVTGENKGQKQRGNSNASNGGGKVSFNNAVGLYSQFDDNSINENSLYLRSTEIMGCYDANSKFRVDTEFATIHSPDLIFDTSFHSMDFKNCELNSVGYVNLTKTFGDIDVQTSTPSIGSISSGFEHRSIITDGAAAFIAGPVFNDYLVHENDGGYAAYNTGALPVYFPVFMWHKNGSLNNDINRAGRSAELLKKVISNYRWGDTTVYPDDKSEYFPIPYTNTEMQLFDNDELAIIKVGSHVYEGNIETLLTPSQPSPFYIIGSPYRTNNYNGDYTDFFTESFYKTMLEDPWKVGEGGVNDYIHDHSGIYEWHYLEGKGLCWDRLGITDSNGGIGSWVTGVLQWRESVSMKYKSTPHLVANLNNPIYPMCLQKTNKDEESVYINNALPMVEVTRKYNKDSIFGGTSDEALQEATWIPCGPAVSIEKEAQNIKLEFKWGDTFFQRYDCLKTYPFTSEDKNQVVEIASFMCETRVNIDGRYDRNRGQTSNLYATPQNYNLINPVYSQMDNFFSYKMLSKDDYKNVTYPNVITWTKTKQNGADVDLWTNLTMANTMELDGDKGEVTKLTRLNNQLLAFQDSGIAQILYNENTQISTTEGVPIEIANSQKVQGKRYLSDTVGCSNKWSMAQTPLGIYFMDSNEKSIYLFNGQLTSLSTAGGFNSWAKQNIPSAEVKWNPRDFKNFVTYYDKLNQEVLFINKSIALAYSEKFKCFTSFYDYGNAPFFNSLDDIGIWSTIDENNGDPLTLLYQHQAGKYCKFFGVNKPYSMTLVANQEPQVDKIFTNLEFRACVEGEGTYETGKDKFTPSLPFDSVEAWDEYQHGLLALDNRKKATGGKMETLVHGKASGTLLRKFRTWACDIPRDNAPVDAATEAPMGIKRFDNKIKPLDRIRNPWAYIKLRKEAAGDTASMSKVEVHDIVVTYFD